MEVLFHSQVNAGQLADAVPAVHCCSLLQDLRQSGGLAQGPPYSGGLAQGPPKEATGHLTGTGGLILASHTSVMERAFRDPLASLPPLSLSLSSLRQLHLATFSNSREHSPSLGGECWQPLAIIISSFAWYNPVFSQLCLEASRHCRAYGNSAKAEESSPWFPKPTLEVHSHFLLLLLTMRKQRGRCGNADRDHVLGQTPASS